MDSIWVDNFKSASVRKFPRQTVGQTTLGNTIWRILDRSRSFGSSSWLSKNQQNDLKVFFVRWWAWVCVLRIPLLILRDYWTVFTTAIRARSGFELIMLNRFKTSTFQRQRDISPLSARIKIRSRLRQLRSEADHLLFLLSYKATSRCANSIFIPSHLPLE